MNAKEKLLKARSLLILDNPFFGCLALKLEMVENSDICPTMGVDGKRLFYNPQFVEALPLNQLIAVIAHEILHISLGHLWRIGHRELYKWNVAADYAINNYLIEIGFTLPKECLISKEYKELGAEEIYAKLPVQTANCTGTENNQSKKIPDCGRCGGFAIAEADIKEIENEWKSTVSQAVKLSKGNLPGNLVRKIIEVVNPPLPWHILLRDFLQRTAKNDYNWSTPNRRYLNRNIILPSLISDELLNIVIAIDTSGSITEKMLGQFSYELSNILMCYDTLIDVYYCDYEIQEVKSFTRSDLPLQLEMKGGGGTNFIPVFDDISKKDINPAALIYFTDLEGSFPRNTPNYPVLWISTNRDAKAPFGETIHFNYNF